MNALSHERFLIRRRDYEDLAIEVIEKGSAVQCVSTFEGDIAILGSDGARVGW